MTQIFEEPEVLFGQGSEAINFRRVFLHKVWYDIVLDFLLLNGSKNLFVSKFNLYLSLQR